MADPLDDLRSQIDELDREIVKLLNRRTLLGLEAARTKAQNGRPIVDTEREREVLVRVAMANEGPLPQDALLALYRQLIETMTRLEKLETGDSPPS
jgi:chorismate mutase/prephenate dehydratase